jgi:Ran GTPase-activating protein (RanGAP) involved in mRNA processing and transport
MGLILLQTILNITKYAFHDYSNNNKRLVALNLRYNNIGNQGLAQLAKSVSIHEAIEILDLSVNYFDDTGVQALCYSLMMNHTLIELNLSGNGLKVIHDKCD